MDNKSIFSWTDLEAKFTLVTGGTVVGVLGLVMILDPLFLAGHIATKITGKLSRLQLHNVVFLLD